MQKQIITLIDDLDSQTIPENSGQTVNFTIAGIDYEIDLSDAHVQDFLAAVNPFVEKARVIEKPVPRTRAPRTPGGTGAKRGRPRKDAAK